MQETATVILLLFLVFVGFVVYFIFKVLQFFLQATNLYKDMIARMDVQIKLLSKSAQIDGPRHMSASGELPEQESLLTAIADDTLSDYEASIVTRYAKYKRENSGLSVDGVIIKMESEGPYTEEKIRRTLQKAGYI